MKAKRITMLFALAMAIVVAGPLAARAETLSWTAPTTYTDGSAIGSATITYLAVWSTSSSLTSPTTLASSISGTSTTFNVSTAGMARGTTIYFGVRATVGGVNSAYSSALSWLVPTLSPSAPGGLSIQ
jgi:hypothetical protein